MQSSQRDPSAVPNYAPWEFRMSNHLFVVPNRCFLRLRSASQFHILMVYSRSIFSTREIKVTSTLGKLFLSGRMPFRSLKKDNGWDSLAQCFQV